MRWTPGRRSDDLEDRRGQGGGPGPAFGGGSGIRIGIGGLAVLFVLSLLTGQDLLGPLLGGGGIDLGGGEETSAPRAPSAADEEMVQFVSFVLDDTQDVWQRLLPSYRRAKLVLFTDSVRSGCGFAESAMGPFYCPADEKVYVDLGFYQELRRRFGAPGDFAQAYVLAHEVGHHVQQVLGVSTKVHQLQQSNPDQANALSVRLELQADCFAGVWGKTTAKRNILESGDVEEGLGAAAAVGDDRIQSQATGRVNPERWTHGSSQQRVAWFRHGFESGDLNACDTFNTRLPGER
jgi:uncharacterized protein